MQHRPVSYKASPRDMPPRFLPFRRQGTAVSDGAGKRRDAIMPVRLKKLIGTFLLVTLVIVYAILATIIAVAHLGNSPAWVHLIYFIASGLLWVLPAMAIIWWMAQPPRKKQL